MLKFGDRLTDVNTVEGNVYFMEQYEMSPARFMKDYDLELTARLGSSHRSVIKNVVFLEYDGAVNQLFHFEEGDRGYVYADKNLSDLGVFNSEQGAILDIFTKDNAYYSFFIDNGPYCLESIVDDEWYEFNEDGYDGVVKDLNNRFGWVIDGEFTFENTIFVRQL